MAVGNKKNYDPLQKPLLGRDTGFIESCISSDGIRGMKINPLTKALVVHCEPY